MLTAPGAVRDAGAVVAGVADPALGRALRQQDGVAQRAQRGAVIAVAPASMSASASRDAGRVASAEPDVSSRGFAGAA